MLIVGPQQREYAMRGNRCAQVGAEGSSSHPGHVGGREGGICSVKVTDTQTCRQRCTGIKSIRKRSSCDLQTRFAYENQNLKNHGFGVMSTPPSTLDLAWDPRSKTNPFSNDGSSSSPPLDINFTSGFLRVSRSQCYSSCLSYLKSQASRLQLLVPPSP